MSNVCAASDGIFSVSVHQIMDEDFYLDSIQGLQCLILPGDCVRVPPTTIDKREHDSEAIKALAAKYKIKLANEDAYTVENLMKSKNKRLHKGFYAHLVYRHMHTFVSYSLKPYNIRFESACIGYIVVTADMLKAAGYENTEEDAHKLMELELKQLSDYQNQNAFEVTVEKDNVLLDIFSVVGFEQGVITETLKELNPMYENLANAMFN